MIAWWWLLVVAVVVGLPAFIWGFFAINIHIRKELKNPDSELYKYMVGIADRLDRDSLESYAKMAEMADGITKCPLSCGRNIAQALRKTVKV